MQTVPGVQIDRFNVGGNQSGQQSIFVAKGAQTTQGAWNLDGVTVSDMASGASSPTYWDFDAFQEMQVVTGGNDPSIATAGVTLNMVTKRGTNDVHGSARVFITDPAWQAQPDLTDEMQAQSAAGGGTLRRQPDHRHPGLRRRSGRSDRQGPPVALGLLRPRADRPADGHRTSPTRRPSRTSTGR